MIALREFVGKRFPEPPSGTQPSGTSTCAAQAAAHPSHACSNRAMHGCSLVALLMAESASTLTMMQWHAGPIGTQMPRQEAQSCRWAALQPGGNLTRRFFANHPTVLQVGSSVFVHGGLHPDHLEQGADRLNTDAQVRSCSLQHKYHTVNHRTFTACHHDSESSSRQTVGCLVLSELCSLVMSFAVKSVTLHAEATVFMQSREDQF